MLYQRVHIHLFFFLFLLLAYSSVSHAQRVREGKLAREVKELIENNNYRAALPKCRLLYRLDSTKAQYSYWLGLAHLFSATQKNKAVYYLENVVNLGDTIPMSFYYLGRAYHSAYRFDDAIDYYKKYKISLKSNYANYRFKEEVDRKIEMCMNGKILVGKPAKVPIRNLGNVINTTYDEYTPVITADESILMFTSRRSGGATDERDIDGDYYEDIMITRNTAGKWSPVKRLDSLPTFIKGERVVKVLVDSLVNSRFHDAVVGISADGQKLLVYRSHPITNGDIYITHLSGTKWSTPHKLEEPFNSKAWEGSACISADESTFYFSSDRPGGYGGKDIYKIVKLPNGKFANPMNLGPSVNTTYDEDAPFIHPDGQTLYFSSTGHNSMGGYDMFRSKYVEGYWAVTELFDENGQSVFDSTFIEGTWSAAENLGYPLNTPEDDIYFVLSTDGQRGYFSSAREGTFGAQDIFVAEMPDDLDVDAVLTLMKGAITANGYPVEAKITVVDNATGEMQGVYKSNAATGHYVIVIPAGKNYNLSIESPGYLFQTENIYFSNQDSFIQITKDIDLLSGEIGDKIVLKNVFFTAKSNTVLPASQVELNRIYDFLVKNPLLIVSLNAYVDAKVLDYEVAYARAISIQYYLIEKGINPERIISNGYALDDDPRTDELKDRIEFQLLGGHLEKSAFKLYEKRNTQADTLFYQLLNTYGQRTARHITYKVQIGAYKSSSKVNFELLKKKDWLYYLKISKEITPDGYIKYMVGNFKRMNEADDVRAQIVKEGIMDAWVVAYYRGKRMSMEELKERLKSTSQSFDNENGENPVPVRGGEQNPRE